LTLLCTHGSDGWADGTMSHPAAWAAAPALGNCGVVHELPAGSGCPAGADDDGACVLPPDPLLPVPPELAHPAAVSVARAKAPTPMMVRILFMRDPLLLVGGYRDGLSRGALPHELSPSAVRAGRAPVRPQLVWVMCAETMTPLLT
jgi:hypothetical protein